jgi:hypothetical protein
MCLKLRLAGVEAVSFSDASVLLSEPVLAALRLVARR